MKENSSQDVHGGVSDTIPGYSVPVAGDVDNDSQSRRTYGYRVTSSTIPAIDISFCRHLG